MKKEQKKIGEEILKNVESIQKYQGLKKSNANLHDQK